MLGRIQTNSHNSFRVKENIAKMAGLKMFINFLLVLAVIQIGYEVGAAGKPNAAKGKAEAIISKKLKAASPAQKNKYKMMAAKRMQNDLRKAMQTLSTNAEVPADVQASVKLALQGIKSGKLTQALASAMPQILQKASLQQGKPADQLQTILGNIVPNSPNDLKNPLQGTLSFLTANLRSVNNLLGKVAGGSSDLFTGTISSLSGTLGAVTGSLNDAVGSLGGLMGGLLAGAG